MSTTASASWWNDLPSWMQAWIADWFDQINDQGSTEGIVATPYLVQLDTLVVGLEANVPLAAIDEIAGEQALTVHTYAPLSHAALLDVPSTLDSDAVIADLQLDSRVAFAGYNHVTHGTSAVSVQMPGGAWKVWGSGADIRYSDELGVQHAPVYESFQWNLRYMRVGDVFNLGLGGENVLVAVLDSGVAYEDYTDATGSYLLAPDLSHTTFVSPTDFINGDSHANDDNGHGTQMTTLMAGIGSTMAVAPNVQIMPIKVLDADRVGTELAMAEGINWAVDRGADIINMSLAFPEEYVPSLLVEQAIANAREAGCVMIAATGNAGGDYTPYPAAFGDVIGVGGFRPLDLDDPYAEGGARADYSNGSAAQDFLAPGGSHDHDVDQDGYPDAVLSQSFSGDPLDFGYWFTSGTSGAAAQASGVAALLLSAGENPAHIAARLRQSAFHDVGTPEFDEVRGAGLLRAFDAVDDAVNSPFPAGCAETMVYANPTGALTEPSPGTRQATFVVEISDPTLQPVANARVYARYRGASVASVVGITDGSGTVQFDTDLQDEADHPDGFMWALHVEAVEMPLAGCGAASWIIRPRTLTSMDELSFRLLSNLGAGIASSSILLVLDSDAATGLPGVTSGNYQRTYIHRPYGTGMAESSLVALYDHPFLVSSGRMERSFVVMTFGTGMAESSLVLDTSWIAPSIVSAYTPRNVTTLNFIQGTGMAESSIIVDGISHPWDHYIGSLTDAPAIIMVDHGGGITTSARVFDRTFLNPARFSYDSQETFVGHPDVNPEGAGMAESSLVFDLLEGQDPAADLYEGIEGGGLVSEIVHPDGRELAETALSTRFTAQEAIGDVGGGGGASEVEAMIETATEILPVIEDKEPQAKSNYWNKYSDND